MPRKPKIAILTNIVPPYKVKLYDRIGQAYETVILLSGAESNRTTWQHVLSKLQHVRVKHSWGVVLKRTKARGEGVFDVNYKHINPGYLFDLLRERPDLVISAELGFRTIMARAYCRMFRRPLWVWWEGTVHAEKKISSKKAAFRRGFAPKVDRWIAGGAQSADYIASLGVPRERIIQVQVCVDEELFREPVAPKLDVAPKPVLLHIGQFIERKGGHLLLEAAGELQAEGLEFSLLVVGDGPEEDALRAQAREMRGVRFVPPVKPEEVPALYRSADVFVCPTLEDVWATVVNEALWSGLPVICSKYAGASEVILDPENVFDPLDRADFKRALRRAIEGRVGAADTSRVLTVGEVAERIVAGVG